MEYRLQTMRTPVSALQFFLYMVVVSALVGVVLYLVQIREAPLLHYLLCTLSVGICQSLCVIVLLVVFAGGFCSQVRFLLLCSLGILLGSLSGLQIGSFLCGGEGVIFIKGFSDLVDSIVVTLGIGLVIILYNIFSYCRHSHDEEWKCLGMRFKPGQLALKLGITFVFNTLIACILYAFHFKGVSFPDMFVISQCIGLLCCFFVTCAFYILADWHPLVPSFVGVGLGALLGPLLGTILVGETELGLNHHIDIYGRVVLIGLLFGLLGSTYFYIRAQLSEVRARAEEERSRTIQVQKEAVETSLKLLQAQIEPHFLFNTLSNVIGLLDTNVDQGRAMLIDLTRYLRTSLARTRSDETTLGQELEMVRAYLNIFQIRMGERLSFSVTADQELESLPFPSLLIQPLVENGIRHGLDPLIEGGRIDVSAVVQNERLRLVVADTGKGLVMQEEMDGGTAAVWRTMTCSSGRSTSNGVGLQNIRSRLNTLYGDEAGLTLLENEPRGLRAILEIPLGARLQAKKNGKQGEKKTRETDPWMERN